MSVPFHRTPLAVRDALVAHNDAMMAGHATGGPEIAQFEGDLANKCGVKYAVATSSCTEAMTMSLAVVLAKQSIERTSRAREWRVGLPDLTWNGTYNAVANLPNVRPVLLDVDDHGCVLLDSLLHEDREFKLDAVVIVQLYGNEVHPGLLHWCRNRDLPVILDSAQSFELKHDHVAASCLSFHALKTIPLGLGGAVLTGDSQLAEHVSVMRQQGVDSHSREQVLRMGFRAMLPAPLAAMGSGLLDNVDTWWSRRQEVVDWYLEAFRGEIEYVPRRRGMVGSDACHSFVVLPKKPERLREKLREQGIGNQLYYRPLHAQSGVAVHADFHRSKLKNSCNIGRRAIALPTFVEMTHEEQNMVIQAVMQYAVVHE